MKHVTVVGAGIAGLGAAYELRKHDIRVTLIERADEVGGRCRSFFWHGQWHHTGAEALMKSEDSLTRLRGDLQRSGAGPTVDLDRWETVHGERIYHAGSVLPFEPFSLAGAVRLPGSLREKASLARLLLLQLRQRRRHDPDDFSSASWIDRHDGATYLRSLAPCVFDHVIEPFMQYSTLGSGDYGLAWIVFALGDLGWMRRGWWVYRDRGAGGLTFELGRAMEADPGCNVLVGRHVESIVADGRGFRTSWSSSTDGLTGTVESDAVVVAVPGNGVAAIARDLLDDRRLEFFDGLSYVAHHLARYLVEAPPSRVPGKLLLPTIEGFRRVGKITCAPPTGSSIVVTADLKDEFARSVAHDDDHRAMSEAWEEVVRAVPALAGCRIEDQILTRNQVALCRRPVGFATALAEHLSLPPIAGVAFAGDYLLNSTVGCAHVTGIRAARRFIFESDNEVPL